MKTLTLLLLLLTVGMGAKGQTGDWQQYLTELYENDEEAVVSMEEAYEHLTQLALQPLDVNAVEVDDLMQIPGLDLNQVNDILEYRYRYGNLQSIEELAMVESIDRRLRLYLINFLTVKPQAAPPLSSLRHDITLTAQIPTYYRAGDIEAPPRTWLGANKYAGKYLGDPVKHSLRYTLHAGSNIVFSLTGAKSAAEPFGGAYNRWGYDRYAFSLSIKNQGIFRQIVLGHFRAQFGMGLILNNNFSVGKQGMLSALGRRITTFSPHNSTSDNRHFQGVAATVTLSRRLSLSALWSYRDVDATLNADGSVSSVLTSAYHRTEKDMEKKHNTRQMTTAVHLSCEGQRWGVGVSALYSWLNRPLNPTYSKSGTVTQGKMYRLYYPRGNSFRNISLDYRYRWRELAFSGEVAADGDLHLATVNNLSWRSPWDVTLMAVQRYYTYQYNALYGSSFSDGSMVKNESGLYLGAQWAASRSLTIEGYTDIAYFPWYKYRAAASSHSWDNSLMATLQKDCWTFSLRYRVKTKHSLRFLAVLTGKKWNARTHAEACALSSDERSRGFILSQSVGYQFSPISSRKMQLYALAAWFNTDDYDSRLYTYERGMNYTFGSTSYYGKGIRMALLAKADVTRWLTAQGKIGYTDYFDRNTIGTAERMIFSSHCIDLDLQLLLRL